MRSILVFLVGLGSACVTDLHGRDGANGVDEGSPVIVVADLGRWADYPLVKTKFGVYNSGYVPGYVEAYKRDIHLFGEVRPDSLRFDGGLGSPPGIIFFNPPMISGTPPDLRYDFRQVDVLLGLLESQGVDAYWCYSYVPEVLVGPDGNFRHPPGDLDAWADLITAVADHLHKSSRSIAYHEIYNEPDNRDFFVGTREDYFAMYERAATAIRGVDPEARVGGPALAFSDSWVPAFLDFTIEKELPLDFFSFHFYPGNPYEATEVEGVIEMVRKELDRRPGFATTEMHLNEYNSLPINYPVDGPQQKHALAAALLEDFSYFISEPSLTKVHWAQFMDTAGGNWSGMISVDGHRKAVFNAYRIYARMPVDRRHVSIDGPAGVGGMGSADEHRAGVVIWNRSGYEQPVRLSLADVPFERGDVRIYRIDADHSSWGDGTEHEELVPVEIRGDVSMARVTWEGSVPDGGVLYVEADNGLSRLEPNSDGPAKPVRVLHYYPDRSTRAYADFEPDTWIARLGMAGEQRADARVAVIAEDVSAELKISTQVDGELRQVDANSLLGVRLDYEVDGSFSKSVLFHGPYGGMANLYDDERQETFPWIATPQEEDVIRVADLAEFAIDVATHAPPEWSGRALISFVLRNAGPNVRVKFTVE